MPTAPWRSPRDGRPLSLACRTLVSLAAIAAAAAPFSTSAEAHDSLAPLGAPHTWLPQEDWVAHHWIPFDEQALKQALGLRGRDLEAFLYNDHRTLAEIAKRRGVDVERLADDLISPWQAQTDESRLGVLRDRTLRLLTQGHLAQHVFFHVFHNGGASAAVASLLGISRAEFLAERARGRTVLEIAMQRGVSPSALQTSLVDFFRAQQDEGIQRGVAFAPQSARIVARQAAALPCWLRTPHPDHDPGNPYGKAMLQHGRHAAGWPATGNERRADDLRVERVRRSLRSSCWRRPPPWSWPAHRLDIRNRSPQSLTAFWRSGLDGRL